MKREEIRVCILRVGGTNCDAETKRALNDLRVETSIVHFKEIVGKGNLMEYAALILPGGFSYGDYVRAGAIWAKSIAAKLGDDLKRFTEEERPVLGICNGFQVLMEAGLLPGFNLTSEPSLAALATNIPPRYCCRWTYLKHENSGNCIFTQGIPKGNVLRIPVAHSEGRFIFSKEKENAYLKRLYNNDQIVFRYCHKNGVYAQGEYPSNPNGAFHDIAGICNPNGSILGLMPHPERAYHGWQLPDWTRRVRMPHHGDGKVIFQSMIDYLIRKF